MINSMDMINKTWLAPTFSSILLNRNESIVMVGAGAVQMGLHLAGLPGWACPFKSLFGIPCPGCGLTTAAGQLFHGQIRAAIQTHAFAPVFLFSFLLMAVVIFLPETQRNNTAAWIAGFERQTGITSVLLTTLLMYWVIRLVGLI